MQESITEIIRVCVNVIKLALLMRLSKRKIAGKIFAFLLFLYFKHTNKTDKNLSKKFYDILADLCYPIYETMKYFYCELSLTMPIGSYRYDISCYDGF